MTNDHIFSYLDDYIAQTHQPGYAVLINGAWGIGKSHAVKAYAQRLKDNNKVVVHVSLYGVKSVDDIDVMLITSLHSWLNNDLARQGTRIAKAFLKNKLGTDLKVADVLPKSKCDLLIFDDLERTNMAIGEVMGYINGFVEHDGLRVLIVCNENELREKEVYKSIKEKAVGISFEFMPQEREAFRAFIEQVTDKEAQDFLKRHAGEFVTVFQQSQTNNLRLLSQAIWAWCRFFSKIDPVLRKREQGMLLVTRLLVALVIEIKSGRIGKDDLAGRMNKIVAGQLRLRDGPVQPTPLSLAQDRYANLYLHDTVLSDELLLQVLCEGRFEAAVIHSSLLSSAHFIEPEEEPAWRVVWYGIERTDEAFNAAFETMQKQFAARDFKRGGEMVHVFALRLWCREIGMIATTEEEIVASCKHYVDDLFASKNLLAGCDIDLSRRTGAYGLCYMVETDVLQGLIEYYLTRCRDAERESWPGHAAELIELMVNDCDAFYPKISWTNDDRDNAFVRVPVFAGSDPKAFVDALLRCPPNNQRTVFTALLGRYEAGRLNAELAEERGWITRVREELKARLPNLSLIRQAAISNEIRRTLDRVLP